MKGQGDSVNERNLQMSVCECVCVVVFFQVCLIIMFDLMFSFGFNGQVHRYVREKLSYKFALFSPE